MRDHDAPASSGGPARTNDMFWQRVDELLVKSTNLPPELQGIAGWRATERGDTETAARYQEYRRTIAYGSVTARPLLERIRDAIDQPILLLKGPEVAAVYPTSALRPFGDLDILVPDAVGAETRLLADGFAHTGAPTKEPVAWHHHRLPLKLPGTPLSIELHRDPGWLTWMTPPSNRELFHRAVPSATGVDGILTLPPKDHALFLAMHSWRHGPYHSLLHMIDIELMRHHADPIELETTARLWGIERVWRHTTNLLDWCFVDSDRQLSPLELAWSSHLRAMQPRSRRASGIAIRTKSLGAPSTLVALAAHSTDLIRTFTPLPEETLISTIERRVRELRGYR